MPGYSSSAASMDLWTTPDIRDKGWYLSLMAPSVKGPNYAWLDPSRLYCHQQGLQECIEDLLQPFWNDCIDLVAGIDAMGFILGAAIANRLGKGFLAMRKAGHLCVATISQTYVDYSGREKVMELRTDAIRPGMHVLLVDQWIETGGTMQAAIKLVEEQGGVVAGVATICIEDSEGGTWVRKNYKCSDCVPEQLRGQFNNHYLESFRNFTIQGEENGDGHFTPSLAIQGEENGGHFAPSTAIQGEENGEGHFTPSASINAILSF